MGLGLDNDTNTNLTRRMLLLLESRELHGEVRHHAVAQILERCLNDSVKDFRPPRFLLNDLVRYWRTICVDFEGKSPGPGVADAKWATRNAKLRTSRKLLFAGGLVSVLLCHLHPSKDMQAFLAQWLDATPIDRLSAAYLFADAPDVGARAVHHQAHRSHPQLRHLLGGGSYAASGARRRLASRSRFGSQ